MFSAKKGIVEIGLSHSITIHCQKFDEYTHRCRIDWPSDCNKIPVYVLSLTSIEDNKDLERL
jgi:hypothetical protein